jgi:hypothetical protein
VDLPTRFVRYTDDDRVDGSKVDLIPALIEGTKSETGCVYYGFTLNKEDNLLICREAYVDGEAVTSTHIIMLLKLYPAIVGLIKMESVIITGPVDCW